MRVSSWAARENAEKTTKKRKTVKIRVLEVIHEIYLNHYLNNVLMKRENKSFFVHILAGIFAGAVSFVVGNKMAAFAVMVVIVAVVIKVLERFLGKEKFRWWFSNGVWIYIFVWIISWTIFYNL
jgi:hypothetical protein